VRGRRIDLIELRREHLPEMVPLLNDRSIARGTLHIPYPYTIRDARRWLTMNSKNRRGGRALGLLIVRHSDGAVVGGAGLHAFHTESACAEVGYWLGRPFRGHGYATDAVQLLLRTGFGPLRLHRIVALVFPRNRASVRVLRRCGFRFEGRIRDEAFKDGRWFSTLQFSRLASDPPVGARRAAARAGSHGRRRR